MVLEKNFVDSAFWVLYIHNVLVLHQNSYMYMYM